MSIRSEVSAKVDFEHKEELAPEDIEAVEAADLDNPEATLKQLLKRHPVDERNKDRIRLYIVCALLYLNSTCNGYDGALLTSIITLPSFLDYFGLNNSPSGTGLVFAIYPIGQLVSFLFISIADVIGRVRTITIGLLIVVAGSIGTACTSSFSGFVASRFFMSFGSSIAMSATPILLIEILPPNRKQLVMVYNTFYYIGSITATWCCYGTTLNYEGTIQFKLPLWLQLLCPGIVLCFVWLMPESPRFHYSKNRPEKAKEFLVKYHACGDSNHPIVMAELNQIAATFHETGFLRFRDYLDFRVFFRSKARRRRSLIVVAWAMIPQFCGSPVVGYYMTTLFLNLGITNATTRLLLTAVNAIVCLIFATGGALLLERIGRRFALLYAEAGFVISMVALASSQAVFNKDPSNHSAAAVGIAFIYIFGAVFFSFAITPLQPTYPSECMSNEMRARGMALFTLVSNLGATLNLYTAPIAMENIKYWYYVFFAIWNVMQFAVVYFFFVETSNLTLEEVEHVFSCDHPVRESIALVKATAKAKAEAVAEGKAEVATEAVSVSSTV